MKTQLLAVCLFFSLRGNTPEPHITKEYSPVREKVEPDLFEDAVRLIKNTKDGIMHEITLMSATDIVYYRLTPSAPIYRRASQIRFCAVT